jgi:hypothetical protein
MGIKFVDNMLKATPIGIISNASRSKDAPAPSAASTSNADAEDKDKKLARQGGLNPLIMTSAQGAQGSVATAGRKMLLGE